MSEVRVNFLNWRPDQEPSTHDGLNVADNLLHDTEGYKSLPMQTGFSTTNPLSGNDFSWISVQVRPIGIGGDLVYCGLRGLSTSPSASVYVGIVGQATAIAGQTPFVPFGGTLISANACRIEAFFVTEFEQSFLVTARVTGDRVTGTTEALNVTSLVEYTFD